MYSNNVMTLTGFVKNEYQGTVPNTVLVIIFNDALSIIGATHVESK